jgi:hypothetical protein
MPKRKRVEHFFQCFYDFSLPIPWDCFVAVLKRYYDFKMSKKSKGGSARFFFHQETGERFTVDEPHGREKIVSKWGRERAIAAIERVKGRKGEGK